MQFGLRVALLWAWSPIFDFAGNQIVLSLDGLVERNLIGAALAQDPYAKAHDDERQQCANTHQFTEDIYGDKGGKDRYKAANQQG